MCCFYDIIQIMTEVLEIVEPGYTAKETSFPTMTFEEFLKFGDEDTWAEWIDGEVIIMYSASSKHQDIVLFLAQVLGLFVRTHNLGDILIAPFAMKLEKERRGREPDLLFVAKERRHLIEPTFLNGAADIVVEVISPESIGRDRGEKFVEYESAGVKEYWLIDYERKRAEFYELDEEGLYRLMQTNGVFHSKIIAGFFLQENWFWQENLPTIEVLKELKILT
jgi:Uma2 family endonuclease